MNDKSNHVAGSATQGATLSDGQEIGRGGRFVEGAGAGDSNRASQVLNEGRALAGLLHHKEYRAAHLLLTIARTPDGAEQLKKWDIRPEDVNSLCWEDLRSHERLSDHKYRETDPTARVKVSDEILRVHRRAGSISADKHRPEIELDALVEAVVASRLSAQFVHLFETRDIVNTVKARMEEVLKPELADIGNQLRWVKAVGAVLLVAVVAMIATAAYFGWRYGLYQI